MLPELSTLYSDRELNVASESNDLKADVIFGSEDDEMNSIVFDDILTEGFDSRQDACHIGVEFKEFHVGLLSEVKYLYVTIPNKNNVANRVVFEGSMDGETYDEIFTIGMEVREGWNYYTIDDPNRYLQYRFYRFKGTHADACRFGEIKFKGRETINNNDEDYSCPVNVVIGGEVQETYDDTVTYIGSTTPVLDSISPKYGTVAGGDEITFTGTGFTTTESDITVTIDGVDCEVTSSTSTTIVCTSGQRVGVPDQTLEISIEGVGKVSTSGILYTYARYWSDPDTWGGGLPPIEGDSIAISKGVNFIFDLDESPKMQAILVEGSLIFPPDEDENHHRTFDARYIFVKGGRM